MPGLKTEFPGCAVELAALPFGMGSFQWKSVEYKGRIGFVPTFFALAGQEVLTL